MQKNIGIRGEYFYSGRIQNKCEMCNQFLTCSTGYNRTSGATACRNSSGFRAVSTSSLAVLLELRTLLLMNP
ncbi:hypothetical protein NECAME_07076 [Necator americanus]|uniref:Uncharacterized protein n=1 Tax=Necator americanus TaxID=51031 RepID=W2TQU3_NECAM|nr:hypothetical protein NECAME_07076 [Necator americanus]ETN84049.1 hypothetical protein NECAME_07076 [Necator americanus]